MDYLSFIIKLIPWRIRLSIKHHFSIPDIGWSLYNLKRSGFNPKYVIDVGAYEGWFTRICKRIYPESTIMMVEPLLEKKIILQRICKKYPHCQYVVALVGAEKKEVYFLKDEAGSQVLQTSEETSNYSKLTKLTLDTLDDLTEGSPFRSSEFLKLDVQGYEIEVLKGAKRILESVEVILMEISVITLTKGALSFYEVIRYMHEQDFRLYDICTFWRRPVDEALWQIDVIFVKNTSQLGDVSKGWK